MKRKEGKASRLLSSADSSSGARAKRPKLVAPATTAAAAPPVAQASPIASSSRPHGKDAALAALAAASTSAPAPQAPAKGKGKERQVDEIDGKKAVFRPVLASPYHVAWPALAPVHATPILHTLLALLASEEVKACVQRGGEIGDGDVADEGKEKGAVSESAARRLRRKKCKERLVAAKERSAGKVITNKQSRAEATSAASPFIMGINSITRHLEGLIRASLSGGSTSSSPSATSAQLLLFICKEDLDPPSLAAHLPLLVCAYNATCSPSTIAASSATASPLTLIPLPANSELSLSTSLNVRRCSSLLLDTSSPSLSSHAHTQALRIRLQEATLVPLRASWLEAASTSALALRKPWEVAQPHPSPSLPRVTHLRTSAPSDMLSAKVVKKGVRGERVKVRREKRAEKEREVVKGRKIERSTKRRERAAKGVERRRSDKEQAKVQKLSEKSTSAHAAAASS